MKQLNLKVILFLFISYSIVGSIVLYIFYHYRWNDSIFTLPFCYGNLLKNMIELGEYKSIEHPALPSIYFTSHRLPFIPYLLYFLSKFTHIQTIGWLALIKNLLFSIPWAFSFYFAIKDKELPLYLKWLSLLFILTFPQILVHGLELGIEEAYIIPVLALFWAMFGYTGPQTRTYKIVLICLIPALFFVKNTFLYICPVLIILQYLRFKDKQVTAWSLSLLMLAATSTAYFNYLHSGRFTYKYSMEGWNIYNGNCERTLDVYPKLTIDILDVENPTIPPPGTVKNEWELDEFYKKKAFEYIQNHPAETFRRLFIKAFTVMIDIRPNGIVRGEERFDSPLKYVGAFYMLLFRVLMWGGIFYAAFSIVKSPDKQLKIYSWAYLFFIFSFYLPYILAFGFERHVIPLVIPVVYSCLYFYDFRKKAELVRRN